jgi:hypothetical protein
MSIDNKIILSGLLVLNTAVVAMEKPLATLSKSSGQSSGLTSYLSGYVTSSFDSITNTITNTMSDYAAFRKLGWPPSDEVAMQELEKSKIIYTRVNESIQKQSHYEAFLEDCNAITRRTVICQRVLLALDSYPDALNLALFCIQHHRRVMNEFDLSRFLAFVNKEQNRSTKGAQDVYQELAKVMVMPNDNELLKDFIKQSTPKKNTGEQEKLAKLEQEKLAKLEQEKLEQERLAKLEQEKLAEQERLAKLEQERLAEQERLKKDKKTKK